ncbi:hypothetical protein BGZ58_002524 [Dissophora ornata]|nr:hypothetical protein BGZ58_002524 [Dissophora ornata]
MVYALKIVMFAIPSKLSSYGEMVLGPNSGVDILFESKIDEEGNETWITADLIAVAEAEGRFQRDAFLNRDSKDAQLTRLFLAVVLGMLSAIRRLTGQDPSMWVFGWESNKGQLGTDLNSIHRFSLRNVGISGLAILRLKSSSANRSPLDEQNILSERYPYQLSVPSIGKRLTLHGSGFGLIAPSVLINNISQGIVANIVHPYRAARRVDQQANSLILTDAKFLPGMEGGAVSWGETGEFAGLSMLPIRYVAYWVWNAWQVLNDESPLKTKRVPCGTSLLGEQTVNLWI